ncbi:MAG: RNA polymerase factor sigma-54 [Hydrogenothermaceae bacterium]|nr:RNA polymerase factor sigma-54 [Hydrogenothermaceae bacterium]
MKQSLNLKLQNKLQLTLSLKTQINLLTLPKVELIEEIQKELQENPFLEEIVNIQPEYNPDLKEPVFYEEDEEEINPLGRIPYRRTLRDVIENQIDMEFEGIDRDIALEIVDSIDEKGFFKEDLAVLGEKYGVGVKYVESIRKKLITLEPTGLASKDLREFLLAQLDDSENFDLIVESIILDDLENINNIFLLAQKYNLPEEDIQHRIDIIRHFKPYPLYGYEDVDVQYVQPDIFIYLKSDHQEGDYFDVVIDEMDIPKINFVSSYKRVLSRKNVSPEVRRFLAQKYEKAIGIVKGIQQRRENLYSLVKFLAEYQREFLLNGKDSIKPLTLKDVSQKIGLHESTISRVVSNKYAVTPQGVLPLKAFFASRATKDSGNISSERVKYSIRELIEREDSQAPLSDSEIANILKERGINIARRTVAKYREELGIPDSRKRKLK